MKKIFKFLAYIFLFLCIGFIVFYFISNEKIPNGKQGKEADTLATKMLNALNYDAYKNTEVITWSFRDEHDYKWFVKEDVVEVSWNENKVILNTKYPEKSTIVSNIEKINTTELIKKAENYFNNDSFWLVAPYKVFDKGTERRIVSYKNKDALLITYTSGGSTPGDSYLWVLDENYLPVSFKMWTRIIPIGGISATWKNFKTTESGILLPSNHKLSLFNLSIPITNLKAYNPKANALAEKVLKAIHHNAYKNTRYLEWDFGGRRTFKWDKEKNITTVSWDSIRVELHLKNIEKSSVYVDENLQKNTNIKLVEKAWNIFNNDSFWLVAPHKLFDNGTIRSLQNKENTTALLIKYTSGGSTPGDSYLWFLDANNIPKAYKMYVHSMKMNGVSATWEDWIVTESGTMLPTNHVFENGRNLRMGAVKGYN